MDTQTAEQVDLPDASAVPGLAFRHFRDESDYPAMLEVNNNSKIADGLQHDLHTLDTLRGVYTNTVNHDPTQDTLIAEVDGQMVAYNRLWWERELDGTYIYYHVGFVLPAWRGLGLGRTMISWVEARARAIHAVVGGDAPAAVGSDVYNNMAGLIGLMEAAGYAPARYEFHMQTPDLDHIPDAPLPTGLEIRPALPEHYHAIWAANAEAFRDHWGATEPEEGDFERWVNHPSNQPDLWVVAWDGDQVAGSILNYINREYNARFGHTLGYTESITVRRPWRRRGLARAMLARSMQVHKDHGMTRTGLGVDTENPSGALQLYESMGYQVISGSKYYRKRL